MAKIIPYINFDGKAREAMNFYKSCLGGELNLMTAEGTPAAKDMTPEQAKAIMHASLVSGDLMINGSDFMGEKPVEGNTVWLHLECTSEAEIRSLYAKLTEGGKQIDKLQDTFWGGIFGTAQDRFGRHWMFNFMKSQPK